MGQSRELNAHEPPSKKRVKEPSTQADFNRSRDDYMRMRLVWAAKTIELLTREHDLASPNDIVKIACDKVVDPAVNIAPFVRGLAGSCCTRSLGFYPSLQSVVKHEGCDKRFNPHSRSHLGFNVSSIDS